MSIIYLEELTTDVIETNIRIEKNLNVKYIRSHLYIENPMLSGEVELSVWEGSTELKSVSLTNSQINEAFTTNFVHGMFRFDFDLVLHHKSLDNYTEYIIKIKTISHTPGLDKVYLVTDLNNPYTVLTDTFSEFSRGYEIYTIDEY
jgi:hypothetical protein